MNGYRYNTNCPGYHILTVVINYGQMMICCSHNLEKDSWSFEYYAGPNYVPSSVKINFSRHWEESKVPIRWRKEFDEMKEHHLLTDWKNINVSKQIEKIW